MPFALLIIGAVLLISAARGTVTGQNGLFYLLESDFTGSDNFIFWFVSILVIGAVGYVPKLKPLSVAFLTLVIIVLFLKRGNPSGVGGGFFSQVLQGVGSTQSASPSVSAGAAGSGSTASQGGSSLLNLLGGIGSGVGTIDYSTGVPSNANSSDFSTLGLANDPSLFEIPGSQFVSQGPSNSLNFDQPSTASVLTPAPSGSDLTFPSLGIGG